MKLISELNAYTKPFMNHKIASYLVGASFIGLAAILIFTIKERTPTIIGGTIGACGLVMIALKGYKQYKASTFQDPTKLPGDNTTYRPLTWKASMTVKDCIAQLDNHGSKAYGKRKKEKKYLSDFNQSETMINLEKEGWTFYQEPSTPENSRL